MSNGLASFKMIYSQLAVDTEILPDCEEYAFIARGDLQYSFTLLGSGCFCFLMRVPRACTSIQAIYTISSLLCTLFIHLLLIVCIDLDMIAKLRFC